MEILVLVFWLWQVGTMLIGAAEIVRGMKPGLIYQIHCHVRVKWPDMWVGVYEDKDARTLYWCLIPMLPIVVWWSEHEVCPDCGSPMHKIAIGTGDGWELDWDCDAEPGMHEVKEVEWPAALGDYATSKDLMRLGFEIV